MSMWIWLKCCLQVKMWSQHLSSKMWKVVTPLKSCLNPQRGKYIIVTSGQIHLLFMLLYSVKMNQSNHRVCGNIVNLYVQHQNVLAEKSGKITTKNSDGKWTNINYPGDKSTGIYIFLWLLLVSLIMDRNSPFVPKNQKTTTSQRVNVSHLKTPVLAPKMLANSSMHASIAMENTKATNVTSKPTNQKLLPTPIRVHRLASWLHVAQYDSRKSKELIEGFSEGFPLHYEGPCEFSALDVYNLVLQKIMCLFQILNQRLTKRLKMNYWRAVLKALSVAHL